MSIAVSPNEVANPVVAPPVALTVQRRAFYLVSQGQPLLAWLHFSPDVQMVNHGVVICSPVGHEQLHAHRTMRHTADTLARQGIPTLRFDWHGTGDSAGIDEDPARGATWLVNLRDAIDWMRQQLGCRQVSTIGLRLGALLSALASEENEIANLVLWAPVTNGRAYVREMTALDLTAEFRPQTQPSTGDIEAAGFVLSKLAAAELSQWNLLKSHPWCQRALVVARDDVPADYRLRDRCSSLGVQVDQIAVPGYLEMLAEPHRTQVPEIAIEQIVSWLHQRILAGDPGELHLGAIPGASDAVMRTRAEGSELFEQLPPIRERAWRISGSPDVFGIVSEPLPPVDADLPTIVLLNAGAAYRIGPGRMTVHVARQLAARGYRCLRLDVCGLGDSVVDENGVENDAYSAAAFRSVDLALQSLRADYGARRFVLTGLCSGAYLAFQSAASLGDPALVESVLINPLTFFWKDGMTIESAPVAHLVAQHHYWGSALQPEKWIKLLSGRTQIGLLGCLKLLANRCGLVRDQAERRQESQPQVDCTEIRAPGHPGVDDLPGDLARISARGRSLAMIFAMSDPGYSILMHKARRSANRLQKTGHLRLTFIKEADHTFSRRSARQALIDALIVHLSQRFPGGSGGDGC